MEHTGIMIRAARASDLPAVLNLARECGLFETGVQEGIDGFLVGVDGERVVATCGLEEHAGRGLLRTLAVLGECQGRGLGKGLVKAAMLRARERGLRSVHLLTTTAPEFFAALGFEKLERDAAPPEIRDSWEFKTGCPATAILMSCTL